MSRPQTGLQPKHNGAPRHPLPRVTPSSRAAQALPGNLSQRRPEWHLLLYVLQGGCGEAVSFEDLI